MKAYANHGRWVVKCPECNWALKVKDFGRAPEFLRFGCADCGCGLPSELFSALEKLEGRARVVTGYEVIKQFGEVIELPAEFVEIETALMNRKRMNRNWLIGETLNDLLYENKEHGL